MGRLAAVLQNYYKTKGNKIIFKNGLTLNSLAVLIWEILGYKEVDSSVLSRVINGERLFTYRQLKVFCDVLSLTEKEKVELKLALSQDILLRNNIPQGILKTEDHILDSIRKDSNRILSILRLLRKDGHPEETISLSQTFENIIVSKFYLQDQDKKILAKIYNEKSRAFGETSSPHRVLGLMGGLNELAIEFGKEVNDQEILDMAYMNVGGAYYVAKRWKDSSMFLESKFKKVKIQTKLEFMRTLLLDYAHQKDYSKFKETLGRTVKVMNNYKNDNQAILASIYEAIARSLSIFGFVKEARNILDEAKKLNLDPFYSSQILRGYIFTFYTQINRNIKVDNDRLSAVFKESKNIKFTPYERHRNQIEKMVRHINANLL